MRVDPILLEQARREADVFRGAVGHQQGACRESGCADQPAGDDRAPAPRGHIEKEKRERKEFEADGGREEDARGDCSVAHAPRRERQSQRDEIHVAERHLEYEAQEEHVAGGGPRPPRSWKRTDERDADGHRDRELDADPDSQRDGVRQEREGDEHDGDDREVPKLVGQPEDRRRVGIELRAAQQVASREPVRVEVVSGWERARHDHRGKRCKDQDDDTRGPDEASRAHGSVGTFDGPRWRTKNSSVSRMISRERSSSSRVSKPCCPVG